MSSSGQKAGTVLGSMPDHVGVSDDDETLEPWFNDPGDWWDGIWDWLDEEAAE